jgi:hypothetical protein
MRVRQPKEEYVTHLDGDLHADLNTRALENAVKSITQPLNARYRAARLDTLPANLGRLDGLESRYARALGKGIGAGGPAHLGAEIKLGLFNVDSDDLCAARRASKGACEQTDGTCTEHEHACAGLEVGAAESV